MLLFDVGLGWVTSDYISRGLGWVTENGPTAMSDLDEMLRADRCRDMDELINLLAPSGL